MSYLPEGKCDRCKSARPYEGYTMSTFNEQWICLDCKEDERQAPTFEAAREAELQAIRRGETNYCGLGLTVEDMEFLAARREARR